MTHTHVFMFQTISKRLKSTFFICLLVWLQSWQGFHSKRSCSSLASSLEALSLLSLRLQSSETWKRIIWDLDFRWFQVILDEFKITSQRGNTCQSPPSWGRQDQSCSCLVALPRNCEIANSANASDRELFQVFYLGKSKKAVHRLTSRTSPVLGGIQKYPKHCCPQYSIICSWIPWIWIWNLR